MSISAATENRILSLIYMATSWSRYADAAVVAPETSIAISLNNAELDDVASMSTHEVSYSGYSRASVPRNASGWMLVANGVISPTSKILFPPVSGISGETATHFSTGATGGGATYILFAGALSPTIAFTPPGLIQTLTQASSITLD